jgi:hypothetical protein
LILGSASLITTALLRLFAAIVVFVAAGIGIAIGLTLFGMGLIVIGSGSMAIESLRQR